VKKDNETMNIFAKIMVLVLVIGFFLVSCSYQQKIVLEPVGLPEYIYKRPMENDYVGANVAVFNFMAPPYAGTMGRVASECLYEALLKSSIFESVTYEAEVSDMRTKRLMDIANNKGYELIITGDLLYYFEGSLYYPSRVDERIRVIDVDTEKTLWYAKAIDIGPCAPDVDFLVVEGYGMSAPSTRELFQRNAQKFCNMLFSRSALNMYAAVQRREDADKKSSLVETDVIDYSANELLFEGPVDEDEPIIVLAKESNRDTGPGNGENLPTRHKVLEEESSQKERLLQEAEVRMEHAERQRFLTECIHFEFDKARLLPKAKEILRRKAEWLRDHPDIFVKIQGHCDERGTDEFNMSLGARRARSAKRYLVNLGVAAKRLVPASFGVKKPLDPGHSETAWAKNRRAEFLIADK
jgi:peptidoglycan-associated lipoprotein